MAEDSLGNRMLFYYQIGESEKRASDDKLLLKFVEDTEGFLGRLTRHKKAFIPTLWRSLDNAWSDTSDHFIKLRREIIENYRRNKEKLQNHGLIGSELYLKLNTVEHYFGELITSGGKKVLKKLFNAINNLLNSIIQAIGASGAVTEIKDAINLALDSDD